MNRNACKSERLWLAARYSKRAVFAYMQYGKLRITTVRFAGFVAGIKTRDFPNIRNVYRDKIFFLLRKVQTSFGAHPARI
jgi:hypothetical protein